MSEVSTQFPNFFQNIFLGLGLWDDEELSIGGKVDSVCSDCVQFSEHSNSWVVGVGWLGIW